MKEPEHQERTWKSRGKVFGERAEALRLFQLRENSEYDMIETQSKETTAAERMSSKEGGLYVWQENNKKENIRQRKSAPGTQVQHLYGRAGRGFQKYTYRKVRGSHADPQSERSGPV
ncbi:MAG: hypothetical protein K1W28_11185 [Lachnospiraceae bacterium]